MLVMNKPTTSTSYMSAFRTAGLSDAAVATGHSHHRLQKLGSTPTKNHGDQVGMVRVRAFPEYSLSLSLSLSHSHFFFGKVMCAGHGQGFGEWLLGYGNAGSHKALGAAAASPRQSPGFWYPAVVTRDSEEDR